MTLEELEDGAAIRDLIMAYAYLEDGRRWDDMLALYTDDIVRELAGSLTERLEGKAALRERLVAPVMPSTSGVAAAPPSELDQNKLRHLIHSEVVRLVGPDEAEATAQYRLTASRDTPEGHRSGSHEGSYEFRFRRVDGRWLFAYQRIETNNAHNPMFRPSPS